MTTRLTRFILTNPIVDSKGKPTPAFLDALNRFVKETETAINLQPTIQAAADAANEAVAQIESGDFDVSALSLNGTRLIWDGSSVVAEP